MEPGWEPGQEELEDPLTEAALSDPANVAHAEPDPDPTFWRVVVLAVIALIALSVVFRIAR